MSFRINTNVSAMNTMRTLGATGNELAKSITRLSTGLRITQAGDDPAGLIVSEGFRSQIASMGQAIRNNQDAINYAKTAEGALDEVNRLLSDARTLAVAAANSGTLDSNQIQANQAQLDSIVESINRVSGNTQYGTKKLLDGSAGVVANSSTAKLGSISLSGEFNDASITTGSAISITVSTAAQQASVTSATFAAATTTLSAGTFTINGTSFSTNSSMNVTDLVNTINEQTGTTGVQADYTAAGQITLTTTKWGAAAKVEVSDAGGVFLASAGNSVDTGVDAIGTVTINDGSGLVTVTMTGGRLGYDGLTLSDTDGNVFKMSVNGNQTSGAWLAGYITAGASTFQIGANADQTKSLSLGNYAASQLGEGIVSGKTMANLDITTQSGATDAMKVIDAAINEISMARGAIGNFQRNVLESQVRSLGVAKENLAASESAIRDVDVAEEMTNFTKLQILQQSGLSVLAQANSAPQSVLSLLR